MRVFDNDLLYGQFLYSDKIAFFNYEHVRMKVNIQKNFIKKSKYIITDHKTTQKIGEYEISNWTIGSSSVNKLFYGNSVYECVKRRPDIRYSLFKRGTWGQYKVALSNKIEEVIYKFKIDLPWIAPPDRELRPFNGHIITNSTNSFILFAGLFLLEQIFIDEDNYPQ